MAVRARAGEDVVVPRILMFQCRKLVTRKLVVAMFATICVGALMIMALDNIAASSFLREELNTAPLAAAASTCKTRTKAVKWPATRSALGVLSNKEECAVPRGCQVVQTTTVPSFKMVVRSTSDDIVSGNIRFYGEYEPDLVAAMAQNLKLGSQFVDVGGNIGFFSTYAAVLGANVTTFEPIPANVELIKANACINGLQGRMTLYNMALGIARQNCTVVWAGNNVGDGSLVCGGDQKKDVVTEGCRATGCHKQPIVTDRLSCYLPVGVDMLKMDIEGFEYTAVRGAMQHFLQFSPPRLVVAECANTMSERRGQPTFFWRTFRKIFGCTITSMSRDVHPWYEALPAVISDWLVLKRCNGNNIMMTCA